MFQTNDAFKGMENENLATLKMYPRGRDSTYGCSNQVKEPGPSGKSITLQRKKIVFHFTLAMAVKICTLCCLYGVHECKVSQVIRQ